MSILKWKREGGFNILHSVNGRATYSIEECVTGGVCLSVDGVEIGLLDLVKEAKDEANKLNSTKDIQCLSH